MKTLTSPTQPLRYEDLPRDYTGLCLRLLPRPIHNRTQASPIEVMIDLLAVHEHRLSADQKDYLKMLTDVLESWDKSQAPQPSSPSPAAFLKLLLQESGQTAAAVARAIGVDRAAMTRLLNGQRAFTVVQAQALAAHFAVDAGVFLRLSDC